VYRSLHWRQRLSRAAFWPITLPVWLEQRQRAGGHPALRRSDPDTALRVLQGMLKRLRKRTRFAAAGNAASNWAAYRETRTHYTAQENVQKQEWMGGLLQELQPANVLDIGANTGEFSALAANMGADVVALERDGAAAEILYSMSRECRLSIQTIQADIARPTPAVGWDNGESSGLLTRLEGRFELVLMLAVLHHLLLADQIPLPRIIELCGQLTRRYLVIEWVPVSDPMYQEMMRGRDDLYGSLTEADLLSACAAGFQLLRQTMLGNGRTLFLFEKKR
jgi:SAM-dependent methyltransferase